MTVGGRYNYARIEIENNNPTPASPTLNATQHV